MSLRVFVDRDAAQLFPQPLLVPSDRPPPARLCVRRRGRGQGGQVPRVRGVRRPPGPARGVVRAVPSGVRQEAAQTSGGHGEGEQEGQVCTVIISGKNMTERHASFSLSRYSIDNNQGSSK